MTQMAQHDSRLSGGARRRVFGTYASEAQVWCCHHWIARDPAAQWEGNVLGVGTSVGRYGGTAHWLVVELKVGRVS